MTTKIVNYGTNTTITMDLSALASSTTFTSGWECTQIDNTTDKFIDAIVQGSFTVGTTPTLPCNLNVYLWGANVSLATTPKDSLDGTSSAESIVNTTFLLNGFRLAVSCPVLVNTSNLKYDISPFSVAARLGLICLPKFWGIFVAHNMTAALKTDAGNTNSFSFHGIKFDDS